MCKTSETFKWRGEDVTVFCILCGKNLYILVSNPHYHHMSDKCSSRESFQLPELWLSLCSLTSISCLIKLLCWRLVQCFGGNAVSLACESSLTTEMYTQAWEQRGEGGVWKGGWERNSTGFNIVNREGCRAAGKISSTLSIHLNHVEYKSVKRFHMSFHCCVMRAWRTQTEEHF